MRYIKFYILALLSVLCIGMYGQYNPVNPPEPGVNFTLKLKCDPSEAGSFNIPASTQQTQGVGVSLRAYTNTGYVFVGWEENGQIISSAAAFNLTMRSYNTTLTAKYKYDPSSPSEPSQPNIAPKPVEPQYVALNVTSGNPEGGYCNVSSGNMYEVGASVSLKATNNKGFYFINWEQDGEVISTVSTFKYVVKETNAPIVANFGYDPGSPGEPGRPVFTRKLYLNSNPSNAGYFSIKSGNSYTNGSSVAVKAYANKDYKFLNWTVNGEVISENYALNYVMQDKDVTLTANYEYVYIYSPPSPEEPITPTESMSIFGLAENFYPGQTINYPVYLNNIQGAKGLIVDLLIPEGFTADTAGIVLSGRASGHEVFAELTDGYCRVTITGDVLFESDNGKIFEIPVTADQNIKEGTEHIVSITHGSLRLADETMLPVMTRNGVLYVNYFGVNASYARFSYDKYMNRVKFENYSSDNAIGYLWNFGDSATSELKSPFHVYETPGTYSVSLTVFTENDTLVSYQNVLINDKSTWTVSGNYFLTDSISGIRHYNSLMSLIELFLSTEITGNIIINVESGKSFYYDLGATELDMLRRLKLKMETAGRTITFKKYGSSSNPYVSFGNPKSSDFDKSVISKIIELSTIVDFDGVEAQIWGVSFDVYQYKFIANSMQEICSGNRTDEIDFSRMGPDLTFEWQLNSQDSDNVFGFEKKGAGSLPSMEIINEGVSDLILTYTVDIKYKGEPFYDFITEVIVHPSLKGMFSSLLPSDSSFFEKPSIKLSWNYIDNARYNLYLWNVVEKVPVEPTVAGTRELTYNVSGKCSYGNSYRWYVEAYNNCESFSSDTMSFSIGSLPNLHVTSLETSDAIAGEKMTIKWSVRNDGNGSTSNVAWNDYIWLVPDIFVGTASVYMDTQSTHAKLLKTVPNVKSLDPGESYENEVSVEMADRVYGNYWLLVTSDMYDVKDIGWHKVNYAVPVPYTPSASGDPYPFLYANTNSSYNKISEGNESSTSSDNFFYKKINIKVSGLVDLAVQDVVAEVNNTPGTVTTNMGTIRITPTPHTVLGIAESKEFYSGKYLDVTATVKNIGGVKMPYQSFRSILYMSHSPIIGEDAVAMSSVTKSTFLDPDGETQVEFLVQVPYNWSGETYFHVQVDANNQVYELASKQNNWGVSGKCDFILTPSADFCPYDLVVPNSISSQVPFNVSYNVKNVGPNVPTSSMWNDKIYISKKEYFDKSATYLGELGNYGYFNCQITGAVSGALIDAKEYKYKGDNYKHSKSITIDKVDDGEYYIFVKVNADSSVVESESSANNIIRSGMITCRIPDLQVELLSVSPDTVKAGSNAAFAWKLKNTGKSIIKNQKVTDAFYISRNQDGSDATLIGTAENEIYLNPDGAQTLRANIAIPKESKYNGLFYLFAATNKDGKIEEKNYSNNRSAVLSKSFLYEKEVVPVSKYTSLSIENVSCPSSGKPGETLTLSYYLWNSGNKKLDIEVSQDIVLEGSNKSVTPCEIVSQTGSSVGLGAEDYVKIELKFRIPKDIYGGNKQLCLYVDRNNVLKENDVEHKNWRNSNFKVEGNLPKIKLGDFVLPDTAMTSTDIQVKARVYNTGEWKASNVKIGIYKSDNGRGKSLLRTLVVPSLGINEHVDISSTITFSDNSSGRWNITLEDESDFVQLDDNVESMTRPLHVELSPLPDLYVKSMNITDVAWSGQTISVSCTYANKGEHKTRQTKWTETYYLSSSNTLNSYSATQIGSIVHQGALGVGEEYSSRVTLNIPKDIEGNYVVFSVIDATDVLYESDENNNKRSFPVYVNGYAKSASDLTVSEVTTPSSIKAGAYFKMSYSIDNIGEYTAKGSCKDIIYLSKDNVWDYDDILVGTVSGDINIGPGNSYTREVTGRIVNIPEGNYYVIVKTNSTRSIAEIDVQNNAAAQSGVVHMEYNGLKLEEAVNFDTEGIYKLNIPDGYENKTIGVFLNYSDDIPAGLYIAYDKVPSTAIYDVASFDNTGKQQEVIIPNVKKGNYYILAQNNAAAIKNDNYEFKMSDSGKNNDYPFVLSTKEMKFGASTLSINSAGNGGWISTGIKGAFLDSIMDFRLVSDDKTIPVEALQFESSTSTHAVFNLNNAEVGTYDVVSELPDGTTATLPNGFTVVPASSVNIELKLDGPSSFRLNSYAPMTLAYFNNGNNDVELYEIMLTVDDGYIAETYDGLDKNRQKVLHFRPDYKRNSRGYISLPPGERCVLNFFIKTGNMMDNNVSVYVVK